MAETAGSWTTGILVCALDVQRRVGPWTVVEIRNRTAQLLDGIASDATSCADE